MEKSLKEKFDDKNAYIKVSVPTPVDGSQKAALNRRGNQLFNDGKIEEARRVFMTTGYSDGLSRVGDYYKSKGRILEALKMYWIAPDKNKSQILIEQLSSVLQSMINEPDMLTDFASFEPRSGEASSTESENQMESNSDV
ncbi:MAG: hypothetical protein FWB86_04360 [Treponema sp.]|nr:hypothetical protein [Treponema sp.]MCL2250295.1 hypothetical protein [Treponema sp.]